MAPGKAVDGWVSLRVDVWGKVRGVGALHVVDASILPDIPSAPTNLTTIMAAERIAAKLSAGDPRANPRIDQFIVRT